MKWMFTYAAICCIPFSYNGLASINFTTLPTAVYADLAFIVFGATFLSYLLVPIGQHRLRPTLVTMYCYLQPIVASMLAVLWGMDRFTPTKGAAILLVFVGVYLVNRSKSRARWKPKRSKPHAVPLRMRLLRPTFRKVPDAPEKRPPRKHLTNNCSNRINISVSARNRIMAIAPYSGNISA